jgi:hypothetical protein
VSKYPLGKKKRSQGLNKAGIPYFPEEHLPEKKNTGNIKNIGNIRNISVIKIRKILYEQKRETSLFQICRSVTPCGGIPGTVQREGALSLSGTKRSKL